MKIIVMLVMSMPLLVVVSCARLGAPTGGPKDETPPKLIDELSSDNYQTNFTEQKIVFEFDEWIVIQNPIQEVVVSPPLSYPFKFETKGRAAIFSFSENEELKPDVTYQINFGDAVKDFTVGNVFKNFIYVFSTGDKIDSLSMSGTIVNALDGKPREDILLMLYDNLSDTCITTIKPFYFTRSDNEGAFKLENLRQDTFRIYALKDENVNYIYDLPTEQVGFLDSLIVLNDTTEFVFDLELFDEIDDAVLIDSKQEKKGLIKTVYNVLPNEFTVTDLQGTNLNYTTDKDTIMLWHNIMDSDSTQFIISYENGSDTIINKRSRKSMIEEKLKLNKSQRENIAMYEGDSIRIEFNHYLVDNDSMQLILSDTINTYMQNAYRLEEKQLIVYFDSLKHSNEYSLEIMPNAMSNIYAIKNLDTIAMKIVVQDPSTLGNLNMKVINTQNSNYAIQLIKADAVIKEMSARSDTSFVVNKLESGKHSLRVIEDIVPDGKWTPGNVLLKRQSERIKEVPLEELRAGWDIEFELDINKVFNGVKSQ